MPAAPDGATGGGAAIITIDRRAGSGPTKPGHSSSSPSKALHQVAGGLMFALGVAWVVSTEFVVLRASEVLPYVYIAQIVPLLVYRFISYARVGWSHFTLELCYLSNALLILNVM